MTRILSDAEIEAHFSIQDWIPIVEDVFIELAKDQASISDLQNTITPLDEPRDGITDPTTHVLRNMGGSVKKFGVSGLRINSDIVSFPADSGSHRIPSVDGKYNGFVLLFSHQTGELLMIFPDGLIQTYHVAGGLAMGAKYLAKKNASTHCVYGSSRQARQAALAIDQVQDIDTVQVYSPTRDHRESFANDMNDTLSSEVVVVDAPQDAAVEADIVTSATSATSPTFDLEWIEPGTHIGFIRPPEAPHSIYTTDNVQVYSSYPRYERIEAMSRSINLTRKPVPPGIWCSFVVDEESAVPKMFGKINGEYPLTTEEFIELPRLTEVMAGTLPGRTSEDEITVFEQVGRGVDFVGVGQALYNIAEQEDLGTLLPTALFTQENEP